MRILVTGSTGFLGKAIIGHLSSLGHDLVGVDRQPGSSDAAGRSHVLDVRNVEGLRDLFRSEQPELVVHGAARIDIDPRSRVIDYGANIEGVAAVIRAVTDTASVRRAIWTSSQLVSRIGRVPTHELDYAPDSAYGDSKVITERLVRTLDGGGKEWSIIRPTTVWGPGMSDHYLSLLRYIDAGRYVHVGHEPRLKSFCYIRNGAYQIGRLLVAPAAQIHRKTFYIADYEPVVLQDWCNALAATMGRPAPRTIPIFVARLLARLGDVLAATVSPKFKFTTFRLRNIVTPYVFDMEHLASVVGDLPVDSSRAVSETVAWYREQAERTAER